MEVAFHKAAACGDTNCVEVGVKRGDEEMSISVRNSQSPTTIVRFTEAEWRVFIEGVKLGEFDV